MLNKLGEMGGVVLFVFLLDLFATLLMAFHIVEVLLSVSTSLSKYAFLAERTKLFTLFLCFLKSSNFFSFLRQSQIAIATIASLVSHGGSFGCFTLFFHSGACLSMIGMKMSYYANIASLGSLKL